MDLRAALARVLERRADLHPLDALHAAHRARQSSGQAAIVMDVRSQTGRQSQRHDFDHAAERILVDLGLPDRGLDARGGVRIGAAHLGFFRRRKPRRIIRRIVAERARFRRRSRSRSRPR